MRYRTPEDNDVDRIDAKEAVRRTKEYLSSLFADEDIGNLGLEELDYDDARGLWSVTIGFVRVWKRLNTSNQQTERELVSRIMGDHTSRYDGHPRTYKAVTISDDGKVLSIKNRDIPDVA
jgi:hypothetical protein